MKIHKPGFPVESHILHDSSTHSSVEHAYLMKNGGVLVLLTFVDNVKNDDI